MDVWEGPDARVEAARYCEMWGIGATVLLDETAAYARELGIRGVPTNVFVDADGTVVHVGACTEPELLREARRLAPGLDAGDGDGRARANFSDAFRQDGSPPAAPG